jgi:hypothetical protein
VKWRYEVKSYFDEAFEFEFTQNEMRSAAECASDGSKKYRILYVPYVFDPSRWQVMKLPNSMSDRARRLFRAIGTGSSRRLSASTVAVSPLNSKDIFVLQSFTPTITAVSID